MKFFKVLLFTAFILALSFVCLFSSSCASFGRENEESEDNYDTLYGDENECEHDWEIEYSQPSTCTVAGYDEYVCVNCGGTRREALPVGAHHEIAEGGYAPGCTQGGYTDRIYCDLCGYIIQESQYLDPTGHTEGVIAALPASCTENGLTGGKECTVCGEILEQPQTVNASHTPETVSGYEPTCTEDGLSDGVICAACGVELEAQSVLSAGHVEEIIVSVEATCTEDGHGEGLKCSRCEIVLTEPEVYPASHVEYVCENGYFATCTVDGMTDKIGCSRCGEVVRGGEAIPAYHTEVTVAGVAPTCSSTGLTEGKRCVVCNTITTEQEIIPTVAHTTVDVVGYAATCTSDGLSTGKACSVCGCITVTQYTISANGHSFGNDGRCTGCALNATAQLVYSEIVKNGRTIAYKVVGLSEGSEINEVVIPDRHNGFAVVAIDANAFQGNCDIVRVIMTESILFVGDNAFDGCASLETVECADLAQIDDWSSIWYGDSVSLKVKAPRYGKKAAYDIYFEALISTTHNVDRYIMTTKGYNETVSGGAAEMLVEFYSVQKQYYDNCYLYVAEVDYASGQPSQTVRTALFVDGYCYDAEKGMKYAMSVEAWQGIFALNKVDISLIDEKYFKDAEICTTVDGEVQISLKIEGELIDEWEDTALADLSLLRCEYTYVVDRQGRLSACVSEVYTVSDEGEYLHIHSEVDLKEVGAYGGPTAPTYGYVDCSDALNNYCDEHGHSIVAREQVDATCLEDGQTAYSYCEKCFVAIDEIGIIPAAHSYVHGECTECGVFEGDESVGLAYAMSEDGRGYVVVGIGDCADESVVVPEYIYGRPVIRVEADAFDDSDVTEIHIGGVCYAIEDFEGWGDTQISE